MGVCSDPIVGAVCEHAAQEATSAMGDAALGVFRAIADGLAGLASALLRGLWDLMSTTTLVDVTTGAFTRVYSLVFGIALFLMLGFFLLQLITGMLRREPGALARAVSGLAKSVLGSFVVVTLTATLLEITDQVCLGLVAASGTTVESMGAELTALAMITLGTPPATPMVGTLLILLLAGLTVGAVLIVWFSLLIRKALLLIAVVLAPLALAGASWDATRGWVSRWAQFVVALIVSKLVIVVVFLLATSLSATPIAGDLTTWSEKLAGVVLLFVAGFAPYLTYKAISFMGFDMYHAMSVEQEAKSALNRPVPTVAGPALAGGFAGRKVAKVLGPGGGSAGSGDRAAAGRGAVGGTAAAGTGPSAGAGGTAAAGKAAALGGAGAATAGVAVPVIVGAQLAKGAATAGPKAGTAVGGAVDQQAAGASSTGSGADRARSRGGRAGGSGGGPLPAPPVRDVPTVLGNEGDKR